MVVAGATFSGRSHAITVIASIIRHPTGSMVAVEYACVRDRRATFHVDCWGIGS
jgi:tartrate dehydratase alpha subunit/fumarate hydratase class I-like protein